MIWLIAIGSSLYSLSLVSLGIFVGYRLKLGMTAHQEQSTSLTQAPLSSGQSPKSGSGALKSLTPLERSLEDSKEIKERINHLLS